jgi:outer membrane protein TolC
VILKRLLRPAAVCVVSICLLPPFASAITLDELVQTASQNSETFRAAEKTIEAVQAEIRGRDLVLSPRIDAEIASIRENKASILPINRYRSQLLTTSLTKLFSTGTQLTATVSNDYNENATQGQRNVGLWSFGISQSLWRDGFGRGTTLRHEAEKNELRSRVLTAQFNKQSFLVELESAYWDLILAMRQEQVASENIERGSTVEKWTRDRVRRSTAETADLLQAQALTQNRELELRGLRNTIATLQNRIKQLVPGVQPETWKIDLKEIENARAPETLLTSSAGEGEPMRLDSLSASFRSLQASAEANRANETLRPRLEAYANYGQSGQSPNFANSWEQSADPEFSSARIGVQFSMELDFDLREDQRRAARLNAEARNLEAQAQQRLSQVSWIDLNRQIEDLKKQADEAKRLAQTQERKVQAERSRYRLGRTTVFQLITFEIDASNSQLTLSRILSDLRKAEARIRIFTRAQDGLS